MDYLFLHRDKRTFTSERQKNLLFKTAHLYWEQKFANQGVEKVRRVDCEIYKYVLYYLEVRQVFLDPKLSFLKSATKLFSVLLASKRPLITELADKLRLKYPLLPTISPCPTMRLEGNTQYHTHKL